MESFPPRTLSDQSYAVEFLGPVRPQDQHKAPDAPANSDGLTGQEQTLQQEAKDCVRGIARFLVNRKEFDKQAAALRETNPVYKNAVPLHVFSIICDEKLRLSWSCGRNQNGKALWKSKGLSLLLRGPLAEHNLSLKVLFTVFSCKSWGSGC